MCRAAKAATVLKVYKYLRDRIADPGGRGIKARLKAAQALLAVLCVTCMAAPAQAVTYDEIPDDVLDVLPPFIFQLIDPQALAFLTVEDLREYADAYEEGRMHFIADVRVVEHSGPLEPELATLPIAFYVS